MQIQNISVDNIKAKNRADYNSPGQASAPTFTRLLRNNPNEKNNNKLKHAIIGVGLLAAIIVAIKHKNIANIFKKNAKTADNASQSGAEKIADLLSGKANSENLAAGATKANEEAKEILKLRQKFPELLVNREERRIKFVKNKEKARKGLFDLNYYKDEFRVNVTVPAERLKILKESTNPELKKMFELDKKMFQINDGTIIHGRNDFEKKKLLEALIEDAKRYDMDVVVIKAGDTDPITVAQQVAKLFPDAKQKFLMDKKHTMFVFEDADKILNIKDRNLSSLNGPCRGQINVNTNNCGKDGVTWVSTVKDLSQIDDSCYRGGRVSQVIDIDKVISLT